MNDTKPYLRDYESDGFTPMELICCFIFIAFIVMCIIITAIARKDYDCKVPAALIESELIHQDRELIGYTTTAYQMNARVYDKPYIPDYYVGLYEYEYEGTIYKFYRRTYSESPAEIEVLLKSDKPEEFTISEDFLEFGEDVRYSTKPVIE